MPQRILVPLDASAPSQRLIPYASAFAKQTRQAVTLFTMFKGRSTTTAPLIPASSDFSAVVADPSERQFRDAEAFLERMSAQFEAAGVATTSEVVAGSDAADEIERAATRLNSELIVMATHGRVGPERWFLGSVADRVARESPVPVLLVRPRDSAVDDAGVKAIIVPLDGSLRAERSLPYVSALALALDVPVTLLRSEPVRSTMAAGEKDPFGAPLDYPAELIDGIETEGRAYLAARADQLRKRGIETTTHFGDISTPAAEIVEVAEGTKGALIVMTTKGRTGLERAILGSVTDNVVRSSAAPVLVVPSR